MSDAHPPHPRGRMLSRFDHVTLAVHDLDAASAQYARLLGRPPRWRGSHPGSGSVAALFGVGNAVIELVAPDGDALEAEGLRTLLSTRGEGLVALGFATDDAAALSASLRARGLRATPPEEGEARGDDGSLRSYRAVTLSPRATRGLTVLAVERADLATLAAAEPDAAALVDALDAVVLRTRDPDAAARLYGEGLGIRLALDRKLGERRMLFFRLGGVTLEIIEDGTLGADDTFYGLSHRVRDLDAAHARLSAEGFALSEIRAGNKPGTTVFTVRDGTCGVPTLFLRDPSRDRA